MQLFGDYDGSIARWNNGRVIPAPIQQYIDFLSPRLALTDGPIIDIGCGKGILAAALAETVSGRDVYAVDRQVMSIAEGRYFFTKLDVSTEAVSEFLSTHNIDVVVSRRSLCLFLSDEWISYLSGVKHLFSEALNNEDQRFTNSYAEAKFLREHGWDVEVDGRFIHASRS